MIKFKLFGFRDSERAAPAPSPGTVPQAAPAAPDGAQINPNGKRVLIVDDDPVFLMATKAKLQSAGCRVRTAQEASEAIAALGEEPADAVLMDITFQPDVCNGGMGSWDGFMIMTWLRGHPSAKGARFVMVSNSDSPADRLRAQQTGAVAYFHKPLDHERLLAAINAKN
jgi:CheY-like chemotaxis protein